MYKCQYCETEFERSIGSGHLRKCEVYQISKKPCSSCLCGHIAPSLTVMKQHRKICDVWVNRNKISVKIERQIRTYKERYGNGVTNAMHIEKSKEKLKTTCLNIYGDVSPLGRNSIILDKIQSNNRRNHAIAIYEKSIKRKKNKIKSIDFDFNKTMIKQLKELKIAREFLTEFHYAGFGRNPTVTYQVKFEDETTAIIKFATPVRKEVATSMGLTTDDILELDRFCINPKFQRHNFASFIMKRVIKLIKQNFPNLKMLISFADTGQGHDGTIYRASNWKQLGVTRNSYIYVDWGGKPINKKTVYNRACLQSLTERELVQKLNLIKVETAHKIKFGYKL